MYNIYFIIKHGCLDAMQPPKAATKPSDPAKIYVTLIGSAPMASLDALMLSLERFKGILSSDSAKTNFETTVRSIQPNLASVNTFIDAVYAVKDPRTAVTMTGRTLIIEIGMTKNDFLECVDDSDVDEILTHIIAVGTLPAKKSAPHIPREYISFRVRYANGRFNKS